MMTLFSKPASSNDTVSEVKGCGGKAVFSLAEAASGLLLAINLQSTYACDRFRCLTEHLHPMSIAWPVSRKESASHEQAYPPAYIPNCVRMVEGACISQTCHLFLNCDSCCCA